MVWNDFKLKEERCRSNITTKKSGFIIIIFFFFYYEGSEVVQRGGWCSIPGDIQGQAELDSEQPDLAMGIPVHGRGVDPDDF